MRSHLSVLKINTCSFILWTLAEKLLTLHFQDLFLCLKRSICFVCSQLDYLQELNVLNFYCFKSAKQFINIVDHQNLEGLVNQEIRDKSSLKQTVTKSYINDHKNWETFGPSFSVTHFLSHSALLLNQTIFLKDQEGEKRERGIVICIFSFSGDALLLQWWGHTNTQLKRQRFKENNRQVYKKRYN